MLEAAAQIQEPSLSEAMALVASHLGRFHDLNEQSIARNLREIAEFCTYTELSGIELLRDVEPSHCVAYMDSPVRKRPDGWGDPEVATRYLRRTALRLLFRTCRHLTLIDGDPTIDIILPPRSSRRTRPLDDDEEATGRLWSQPTLEDTRHPLGWALARSTMTGSEMAVACVEDLDLSGQRIWVHGNEKWREPRWAALGEWELRCVEARLSVIGTNESTPLLTEAKKRSGRQASSCEVIRTVMRAAGLRVDPGVKPASLPAWAGAKVFERTGRIDEAAHAMGVRSLDRAAGIIRCDW